MRPLIHKDSREDLVTLKELIEAGSLTPVLHKTYPLAQVPEAIQYVRDGPRPGAARHRRR